jgi:hypothetical protein
MYIVLAIVGVLVLAVVAFFIAMKLFAARMQHYIFAHQLLPAQALYFPAETLVPLVDASGSSQAGREHLLDFWQTAGEGLSGKHLVPSDGLKYQMVVLGHPNSTAFLIELPPPIKKPEAYGVLIVFDAPGLARNNIRHLRYFVLEFHGAKGGMPKAGISEWTPKGDGELEYVDHGECTRPGKKEFAARVQQIIKESGSQP